MYSVGFHAHSRGTKKYAMTTSTEFCVTYKVHMHTQLLYLCMMFMITGSGKKTFNVLLNQKAYALFAEHARYIVLTVATTRQPSLLGDCIVDMEEAAKS